MEEFVFKLSILLEITYKNAYRPTVSSMTYLDIQKNTPRKTFTFFLSKTQRSHDRYFAQLDVTKKLKFFLNNLFIKVRPCSFKVRPFETFIIICFAVAWKSNY